MYRIHPGILTKCPVKNVVPDFPCPGHYKHNEYAQQTLKKIPCGQAEHFCSLGVFSDIMCSPLFQNPEREKFSGDCSPCGTEKMLERLLIRISTKNVDRILQLGNILNANHFDKKSNLDEMLSTLSNICAKSHVKVLPSIGNHETAIRQHYMQTPLANTFREYGLIKQPSRCCGMAYHATRIGPEWMLIVLDGYELLVASTEEDDCATGESKRVSLPVQVPFASVTGTKCARCEQKAGRSPQVGWCTELMQQDGQLSAADLQQLPPIRSALSEQQLQWLNLQLQEATRKTDNVVVACHAPLHPLLVRDRSALPMNWKDVLRLLMTYTCVKLVLHGRPETQAAHPPNPNEPYQMDHGILYYSLPPAWELTQKDPLAWTHMIVEMGYDFIRIKGEGIPIPPSDCPTPSEWVVAFEPRRKLSARRDLY